jgi:hypothetical protein
MIARSARWGLLLGSLLSASAALAASGDARVRINAVQAPLGTDAKARAALSESLRRHLSQAELAESLRPYTVSPSLLQLRRYVEDTPKQAKLVCLIDLALNDSQGNIVASVRGSATTRDTSQRDTIDAAAHAAVARLPTALHALGAKQTNPSQLATR